MSHAAVATKSTARLPAGAAVGIPPRQVDFRFPEHSARYFYDNNPFATHFFGMLSGIFPPGEMYFVDAVRHYRSHITDKTLLAKISGFIGQEALHGREHDRLNDMLDARGIHTHHADRAIRVGLNLLKKVSPAQQLACTAFMEHFTALLGEQLLSDETFRASADPEMLQLWMWHALEELEHKAVTYDVYQKVSDSRARRFLAVPLVAGALLPAIAYSMVMMLKDDNQLRNRDGNRRGLKLLFDGKNGFISRFLPKMTTFLRKDFHPDYHDTDALVAQWKEKLFGEHGELNDIWRNKEALSH